MKDLTNYINRETRINEYLVQDIYMDVLEDGVILMTQDHPRYGTMYTMYLDMDNADDIVNELKNLRFQDNSARSHGPIDVGGEINKYLSKLKRGGRRNNDKYISVSLVKDNWIVNVTDYDAVDRESKNSKNYNIQRFDTTDSFHWQDFVVYAKYNNTINNPIRL